MKFESTHTITDDADYYSNSPQQGFPPDGVLKKGTAVRIVEEGEAYSKVELETGESVHVQSDALQSASKQKMADAGSENKSAPGVRKSTEAASEDEPSAAGSGHLDYAELNYGGRGLRLTKSTKYVAIKPRPEIEPQMLSELLPEASGGAGQTAGLGGFQLVKVAEAQNSTEATLDKMRANSAVKVGTHVFHTSDDEVPFVPTGQIYIEYEPDAPLEECQALLEQHHLEIVEARNERELIVQITPQSENPIKTASALQDSEYIKIAEPDLATPGKIHSFVIPQDARIIDQWHLRNTGFHHGTSLGFVAGADAKVIDAWQSSESLGSPNVVVAVIDDGFDLNHPDLTGTWKLVAPKDFTRNSANPIPDPLMEDWHGTACAGVAVGNADGTGICGAAPRSRLMPVRWGRNLSDREIENWFDYVRVQGAWVVSCSWGADARNFPLSTRAFRAIEKCAREGRDGLGTVICFAAGNENRNVNAPALSSVNGFAIHPDVIAVAASNSRDRKSDYSNFGAEISICAPSSGAGGWGITTADVMGQYTRGGQTFEAGYSPGAYTNEFGGTSSACPLVAGICALILSTRPQLTARQVRQIIEQTARKIGGTNAYDARGHSQFFGFGCIDAVAAVSVAAQADPADEDVGIAPFFGQVGHETINEIAVNAVPGELQAFYKIFAADLIAHAMDADHAKNHDATEKPRHFIDIDLYGSFPFAELPEEFEEAKNKYGEPTLIGRGIVPWQIERTYDDLVAAFSNGDWKNVVRHSAWLGHYVADAHVPLHTTANHDGQLTGQKGLHSYFETRLVKKHVAKPEIKPAMGQAISERPHKLAFRWVRESYTHLQTILDADAANGGKINKRNLTGFATIAKPIVVDRMTKASSRVASLWFSAWLAAGKPSFSGIDINSARFSPQQPQSGSASPVIHKAMDLSVSRFAEQRRYLPPAGIDDFSRSQNAETVRQDWHRRVSGILARVMNPQRDAFSPLFYDQLADTSGVPDSDPQGIPWNGFPLSLTKWFSVESPQEQEELANRAAEVVLRLASFGFFRKVGDEFIDLDVPYRVQDEYCEWHVEREGDRIRRISFTCEPPEYWEFLAKKDFALVHKLYEELLHRNIPENDLKWQHDVYFDNGGQKEILYHAGDYNPYNVWNTEKGAVHLTHWANSLEAEIFLASDGTLGWAVNPDAQGNINEIELMCCAARGGINRSSDPLIFRGVFNFARQNLSVALANPIGLYMTPFSLNGLLDPDENSIGQTALRFTRQSADKTRILRAEIEPPQGASYTLDQCTLDGRPLLYGGQIARKITMSLFGVAKNIPGRRQLRINSCPARCCDHPERPQFKGTFSSRIRCENVPERAWQDETRDIPKLEGQIARFGDDAARLKFKLETDVTPLKPQGRWATSNDLKPSAELEDKPDADA